MVVPSPLSKKLREDMGAEAAEDVVTRLDEARFQRDEFRAPVRADFAGFRQEILAAIHDSEIRMVERIHKVQLDLGETLGAQFLALDRRIGDVKADLMKWSFAFWIGAVAAIAALAGVLR